MHALAMLAHACMQLQVIDINCISGKSCNV